MSWKATETVEKPVDSKSGTRSTQEKVCLLIGREAVQKAASVPLRSLSLGMSHLSDGDPTRRELGEHLL